MAKKSCILAHRATKAAKRNWVRITKKDCKQAEHPFTQEV